MQPCREVDGWALVFGVGMSWGFRDFISYSSFSKGLGFRVV